MKHRHAARTIRIKHSIYERVERHCPALHGALEVLRHKQACLGINERQLLCRIYKAARRQA